MNEAQSSESKRHFKERTFSNMDKGFDPEKNIAAISDFSSGDVEEVLKTCEVVVKHKYQTQAVAHGMMESYRSYAYMDAYGKLVVVSSTQIPFHERRQVAQALGIPASKVRVIKPRIGGGFGGKQTSQVLFYPALVTYITGKPSKIVYGRKETFEASNTRHLMDIEVTLGSDKEGNIKAIDMNTLSDTGAYGEHAATVMGATGYKSIPLYNRYDAARYRGTAVYTNHVSAGAFRGYGVTQGIFALECAVNELAQELDMDPTILREKNIIREGETSPIIDITTIGAKGPVTIHGCELDYCIERGKEIFKWDEKIKVNKISDTKYRGVGMAIAMQGSGIPGIDTASATIKLDEDGTFLLLTGAADIGTGSDTILKQIAAEGLGVPFERVSVFSGDTDLTPFDVGAYASGTTYFSGNAIREASKKMNAMILEEGAREFGVTVEDIDYDGVNIRTKDGKEEISLKDLSKKLTYKRPHRELTATGSFDTTDVAPPYMSGFAEVEVDTETGKIELVDFTAVVDCGKVINPNLVRVQAEGGIVQGIGMALFEDVKYTSSGKLISNSFMEYKIPCRLDVNKIKVEFAEGYDKTGPFGAKSIGEVVLNPVAPAIVEAVYNAVGIRVRELPLTPEKIKMKLIEKGM